MIDTKSTAKAHRLEVLQELAELLDHAAELTRSLHDERLNAYVLAEFEGANGPAGYLGHFTRDVISDAIKDTEDEEDDENDHPACSDRVYGPCSR